MPICRLPRSFAQLLELSAEVSKEVTLSSQEAWEEARGVDETLRSYFSPEDACRDPRGTSPAKTPAS